jgi:hypothetical protein
MKLFYWMVLALYILGLLHLILGVVSPEELGKARSYAYAAAMFAAGSAIGVLQLLRSDRWK